MMAGAWELGYRAGYCIRCRLPGLRWTVATALALALAGGWGAVEGHAQFNLPTRLPAGSFTGTAALGINAGGSVVGLGAPSPGSPVVALFWSTPAATPTALPSGEFSPPLAARGINTNNQIVGVSGLGFSQVPLYWASPTSAPTQLPHEFLGVSPIGINDAGQIVGASAGAFPQPLFWASPTSTPQTLPTGGFTSVFATGISLAGHIVGGGQLNGSSVALTWASPTSPPVQLPSGSFKNFPLEANGIHGSQIVGSAGNQIPVLWLLQTSGPTALPTGIFTAPLSANGIARDIGINSPLQIVGYGSEAGSTSALLWTIGSVVGTGGGAPSTNLTGLWGGNGVSSRALGGYDYELVLLTLSQQGTGFTGIVNITGENKVHHFSFSISGSVSGTTISFSSPHFFDSAGCGTQLVNGTGMVMGGTLQGTFTLILDVSTQCGTLGGAPTQQQGQFTVSRPVTVYCGTFVVLGPASGPVVFMVFGNGSAEADGWETLPSLSSTPVVFTGQVTGTSLSMTSNQGILSIVLAGTIANGSISGTISGPVTGTFTGSTSACPGLGWP